MYGSVSNTYSAGPQPPAGWQQGGERWSSANGRWHWSEQHGWQQHAYQQQLQQPYQVQYAPQRHPYQQQPHRQNQYYQQHGTQHDGPQHRLSQKQARAAAAAGPQNAVARSDMQASMPNPRPSKRTRDEQDEKQEPSQKRRQGQQGEQQDLVQPQQQRPEQVLPQPGLGARWLSVLNDDVIAFAKQVLPTAEEQEQRQSALSGLEVVARGALSPLTQQPFEVMLFGSGRAGLALHSSDLDIMITGLCSPTLPDGGYDKRIKQMVANHLRKVEREAYKRLAVRSSKLIAHARIPVLKLELRNGLELDVSLNDTAGIRAANFLQSWQQDYVALRPMVLVLKSILKQNGLGDVATGGLGSWSVANMAIAHLMMEDNAGAQVDSPGHMLFTFFKRYGVDWSLDRDAVAVAQGGITTRSSLAAAGGPVAGSGKLLVRDPLTGREVAGGSHRYADVMQLWRQLYLSLRDRAPPAAAKAGTGGSQFNVLSLVLDCAAVLRRGNAVSHAGGQGYSNGGWAGGNGGGNRKRNR